MPRQTVRKEDPVWGLWLLRAIIVLWFVGDIVFLILALRGAYSAPGASNRFFVWFFLVRLVVLAGAAILERARHRPRFYVPGFSEMSESAYWVLVVLALTAMRLAAVGQFSPQAIWLQIGEYGAAVVAGYMLLMIYQSRIWTSDKQHDRDWRISKLQRKAGLSKAEFEAIAPQLVELNQGKQHTPLVWSVFVVLVTVIVGTWLSTFAGQLLTAIEQYLPLSRILFP